MKSIGLITNSEKVKAISIAKDIYDYLLTKNIKVFLLEEDPLILKHGLHFSELSDFKNSIDCLISIGGDGTFLRAARYAFESEIAVMGVNVGNLGFLAEINVSDMYDSLDKIINNNFEIEKRMIISGTLLRDKKPVFNNNKPFLALNDFVITKSVLAKMIKLTIIINGIPVLNYGADGVIVSTPTGSTAYSLSAGGPVVEPKNEAVIITPICAHTFFSRSLVISPDNLIEIQVNSHSSDVNIYIDGKRQEIKVENSDILKVEKSVNKLNLITFNKNIFFKIFKDKLIGRD